MTLGPLMLDVAGCELCAEDRELLQHPAVGGVILFTRNYESPQQVRALVDEIHALRDPRLLVAVDQEGGRVQRFRDGFTHLPPLACLGRIYDTDRPRAKHLARVTGWLMASELRAVGVDISFAPVLDLDYGVSTVIGNRALHRRPEIVAELAAAYQGGMHDAGMAATGKHFPGHGAVAADSHVDLPVDERRFEDIEQWDMVPFRRMIDAGIAGAGSRMCCAGDSTSTGSYSVMISAWRALPVPVIMRHARMSRCRLVVTWCWFAITAQKPRR
jgi:beta-N-acetylhexosaminidase